MIEEKIAEIFSNVLKRKISITDDVQRDNEELWDSLKHIEISVTLEEEFDISLTTELILSIDSMEKAVQVVKGLIHE